MRYAANDVYACIQGEGCMAGQSMALVRLMGCAVGCPWCDTKETWEAAESSRRPTLAAALGTGPAWAWASPDELAAAARAAGPAIPWALVTGGEPAEQPLGPLCDALRARGFRVALETSGTAGGFEGAAIDWLCVSPKLGMPGGKAVLPGAVAAADEVKMVVGRPADLDALDALLASCPARPGRQVCLQPVSGSQKATTLCVEAAKARGWRLSLQVHKFLGER